LNFYSGISDGEVKMHPSAWLNAKKFFETYCSFSEETITIIEIGSQDINGSIRDVSPQNANYIGLDFVNGKGVDIIINDPYNFPLSDGIADIVVTSSCFEHSEMFWLTFLESLRVLKDNGVLYINAPSNGSVHRFPLDCWRFYPDAGLALQNWARRNNLKSVMLESFVAHKEEGNSNQLIEYNWNDFVAIFLKNEKFIDQYPNRIISKFNNFYNGRIFGDPNVYNDTLFTQDLEIINSQKLS